VYAESLAKAKPGFEIAPLVMVNITDDISTALLPLKSMLSFYVGGMGSKKRNFHMELMSRMGFEAEAHKIQDLFFENRREEAAAAVPDQFADEISLVGPVERIRDRLDAWRETPVTTLLMTNQDSSVLRTMAELVLG
jgi:alkanesulfonate monooxygenase SsuD/methylene tetrahydromethanopterin reductase-like flavin-dependent oxidoreductase (luciferase family)